MKTTLRKSGNWNTRTRLALFAVAMSAMATGACERKSPSDPVVLSIAVTPSPQTLNMGATQQFTAVGTNTNNGAVVSITPVWSVVAGGGTINSSTGMFTAGTTAGTFTSTVMATADGKSGTATVIVNPAVLATITVTPNPGTMAVGAAQQYTAVGRDAAGNVIGITPTWSVVAGGGTIGSAGLFTAGTTTGTFTGTVRAASGAISGVATAIVTAGPAATLVVTPNPATLNAGATQTFTATGNDAFGNAVTVTPVVWSVVNGGGSIDANTGLFTAGATGGTFNNTVRATSGALAGTATVIVNVPVATPVLTTIIVTPNPGTMNTGANQQYTAVGRDQNGNPFTITPVWTVTNGGGTISATGLFTAGQVTGTFANTVKATSGTVAGTATAVVVSPSATSIVVIPNPATMAINNVQQFTAVGRDANGNTVAITPTWTVVNGGGSIDPNTGLFTAGVAIGTFTNTVKATSGSVAGFATVNVLAGPAVSITVTPNPAFVEVNGVQNFTAVGRDAGGNPVPITPVWSVVNGGGTINSNTGRFTAGNVTGTFNNTVQATSGLNSGNATVNVIAAAAAPLVVLGQDGIMAGTAVTCVIGGIINADVSISPGNTITGFGPCSITGNLHLNDGPAIQGQIDMNNAYNTLAGLPCAPANAIVGNLGGTTKTPGVYCTASGIGVTGNLTLDGQGDPNATFVFQAGSSLITAGSIILINGAQAKNVYWQVGSSATLGTASNWQGNILALTSITFNTNATLLGRALAHNGAVTLGTNNIITLP